MTSWPRSRTEKRPHVANYKAQLAVERITGLPMSDGYTNAAMQWGTEQEPFARAAYELKTESMVDQVGLVIHPEIDNAGASPDGLVGDDGLLEIKCPKTSTHLQYLLAGTVPAEYQLQMLWQMACTERSWCDFVTFDPRLPEHLQLFTVRYERDDARISLVTPEVIIFDQEVNEMLARLPKAEPVLV
jgi:putative phage-type endonuclease